MTKRNRKTKSGLQSLSHQQKEEFAKEVTSTNKKAEKTRPE